MNPYAQNTTIKLDLEHNLSSNRITQLKFDLFHTVAALKQAVEKRYGSDYNHIQLILKDRNGNIKAALNDQNKTLGYYGAKDGYIVCIKDTNPNSILKYIENVQQIQKYKISQEQYNKLPQNFRKWKKQHIQSKQNEINPAMIDVNYMKQQAEKIQQGNRVKLNVGHRGTVKYIGKVPDLGIYFLKGIGYFVGVNLDEPYGNCDGSVKGISFFVCEQNYGIFLRPNEVQVGDFPQLQLDDQI